MRQANLISVSIYLFTFLLTTLAYSPSSLAATVKKLGKTSVLIEFDPIAENFSTGEKLTLSVNGENRALLQITKIRNNKLLARILSGSPEIGMVVTKSDVVTPQEQRETEATSTGSTATTTVTILFATPGIWRGQPSLNSAGETRESIQATLDYSNSGLLAGLYVGNSFTLRSEHDVYLGYEFNIFNVTSSWILTRAFFDGHPQYDAWILSANIGFPLFSLSLSYMPEYYEVKSDNTYFNASTSIGLGEKFKFRFHVGRSTFSNESAVGHASYTDVKIGLLYAVSDFNVEFAWTDTDRKQLNGDKMHDGTTSATISKTF